LRRKFEACRIKPRFSAFLRVTAEEFEDAKSLWKFFYAHECFKQVENACSFILENAWTKTVPACQGDSSEARIAHSSSRSAVSFSSARTTKRFPLSRCASVIQIVRPLASIAETQPQVQPALLSFVSDDFPAFHARSVLRPFRMLPMLAHRLPISCKVRGRADNWQ
jgi:hypothetical protein